MHSITAKHLEHLTQFSTLLSSYPASSFSFSSALLPDQSMQVHLGRWQMAEVDLLCTEIKGLKSAVLIQNTKNNLDISSISIRTSKLGGHGFFRMKCNSITNNTSRNQILAEKFKKIADVISVLQSSDCGGWRKVCRVGIFEESVRAGYFSSDSVVRQC
ncbi:hypothetical protein HELRODRAFT_164337 [Helobdella robusta]|uniref:ACT domain-containing protein n=1 Tax=Helobdella robusta TaxID=6412 RepID=T1EVA1_HELRO|nr:hypothetical protein HELRODRAFT_164337 [Helobdella robusta]ESN94483.1 hypothetical protein HELRODRAFT_164337 [Helobdella robusta]